MKKKQGAKNFNKIILICLALVSMVGLSILFRSVIGTSSFIDEDNFIAASSNFISHGNYSPHLENSFDPGVSVGIWCNFPSGIAASLGAELPQIRFVSYLFSLLM